MIDIGAYRRMLFSPNSSSSAGQEYKRHSDMAMEFTWNNDIQSKVCYIYDFFHDDQPDKAHHMTYENTTKTRIDAKFIITQYGSLTKDQVEYHIMFKPSQPVDFTPNDELYYYETEFVKKYQSTFPIGLYIDIPDDRNIYRKWLICSKEIGNQFIKYKVLPCNYHLHWISQEGDKRYKRKMWCALRSQNSYNSGLWTDYNFTTAENQDKIWLPMNSITSNMYYVNINGDKQNQRLIVSALVERPIVWQISKVENTKPFGIQKLTIYQTEFDDNKDYVNLETVEMYADYYSYSIEPEDAPISLNLHNKSHYCVITSSTNTIKVGGSYKTLKLNVYDESDNDVTELYKHSINIDCWSFKINGQDINAENPLTAIISDDGGKLKLKFANNRDYLGKVLSVSCYINEEINSELSLEIIC